MCEEKSSVNVLLWVVSDIFDGGCGVVVIGGGYSTDIMVKMLIMVIIIMRRSRKKTTPSIRVLGLRESPTVYVDCRSASLRIDHHIHLDRK